MKSDNILTTDSLACQDADHCQGTEGQVNTYQKGGVIHNNSTTITRRESKKTISGPAPLQREMSIECVESTRTTMNVAKKQYVPFFSFIPLFLSIYILGSLSSYTFRFLLTKQQLKKIDHFGTRR